MQQSFIHKNNASKLILFFCGWGMDKEHFGFLSHPAADIAICYDYSSDNFDASAYTSYSEIFVIAWSMGVFMANYTLKRYALKTVFRIAVNGTLYPIDCSRGIPPDLFNGTLDGLNELSVKKFNRRMCGSKTVFERFDRNKPNRSIDSLKTELASIQQIYENGEISENGAIRWNNIIIGKNDLIFPAQNQINAWGNLGNVQLTEDAHYVDFENLIKKI